MRRLPFAVLLFVSAVAAVACKSNEVSQTQNVNCASGFVDCNRDSADGCETNTNIDPLNCGGCAKACSTAHGLPSCSSGVCAIQCSTGFGDCNLDPGDGCETPLTADVVNCGACGHVCSQMNGKAVCSGGECTMTSCEPGFFDCNKKADDGCESTPQTDPDNCGKCGTKCPAENGTATCAAGVCGIRCNPNFHLCGDVCVEDSSITKCGAECVACIAPKLGTSVCTPTGCDFTCPTGVVKCNGSCISSPTDLDGVFVVAGSTTSPSTCGKITSPCGTIQAGIDAAVRASVPYVRVASGKYLEDIRLAQGITVQGGWSVSGGKWTAICDSLSANAVNLQPQRVNVPGVSAIDLSGSAALETVSITLKAATASASQSFIGVVASGSTTTLSLHNVTIVTRDGGNGVDGANGANGTTTATCYTAGDGASATVVGANGTGSTGGAFGTSGFTVGSGTAGADGTAGNAGTAGGDGTCGYKDVRTCLPTSACAPPCSGVCTPDVVYNNVCTGKGYSGCGGLGGHAGEAGTGGGSSVGVVALGARVTITDSSIVAGNGGNGGNGGDAGKGAAGAPSPPQTYAYFSTYCTPYCQVTFCNCRPASDNKVANGTPGGPGGAGTNGGKGGSGAGGSSFAIYRGPGSVVDVKTTTMSHGLAGKGGGAPGIAGADGSAADLSP